VKGHDSDSSSLRGGAPSRNRSHFHCRSLACQTARVEGFVEGLSRILPSGPFQGAIGHPTDKTHSVSGPQCLLAAHRRLSRRRFRCPSFSMILCSGVLGCRIVETVESRHRCWREKRIAPLPLRRPSCETSRRACVGSISTRAWICRAAQPSNPPFQTVGRRSCVRQMSRMGEW